MNLHRILTCLLALICAPLGAQESIKALEIADLRQPHNLAFDADGAIYGVESLRTNRIFKLQGGKIEYISGVLWDSAPKGQQPPEPSKPLDLAPAVYNSPTDIAVAPDGSIYVSDSSQHRVVRLDPKTYVATGFAGTGCAASTSPPRSSPPSQAMGS